MLSLKYIYMHLEVWSSLVANPVNGNTFWEMIGEHSPVLRLIGILVHHKEEAIVSQDSIGLGDSGCVPGSLCGV